MEDTSKEMDKYNKLSFTKSAKKNLSTSYKILSYKYLQNLQFNETNYLFHSTNKQKNSLYSNLN